MLKTALNLLALVAAGSAAVAIEAWLDRRRFDRISAWFLAAFGMSLVVLIILLGLHFGRWI